MYRPSRWDCKIVGRLREVYRPGRWDCKIVGRLREVYRPGRWDWEVEIFDEKIRFSIQTVKVYLFLLLHHSSPPPFFPKIPSPPLNIIFYPSPPFNFIIFLDLQKSKTFFFKDLDIYFAL